MHAFSDLTGRVALVTGGGGDIGGASCMALARAAAIRELQRKSAVLVGDCAEDAAVRRMAAEALDAFGRVDILVNVAGRGEPRWFWELERADFDRLLADNLSSAWSWAHALMSGMRAGGWGRII